jgi:CHAT domain-containing protein
MTSYTNLLVFFQKANGSTRPRLWWCATGDFGFLPVHAAGNYSSGIIRECISDYVVSSYIPTLAALAKARQGWHAIPRTRIKSLVLCEESSGPRHLPNVQYELEIVRGALEAAQTHILNSPSTHTSCAQVKSLLAESDAHILHLASHGVQEADPLKSAFLMQDGRVSIQDLMELNLPHAVLSFLSACETAKGDRRAPDQAVHLAASMLFCGFRSVIGSMW